MASRALDPIGFPRICPFSNLSSCIPLLHRHYPASKLVWMLCPPFRRVFMCPDGPMGEAGLVGPIGLPETGIPLYCVETSFHSVTNHPSLPKRSICFIPLADLSPTLIDRCAGCERHLGLRHLLAGSPQRQAESCSSSYGLEIHIQLLSTSPCKDAVTFS